MSKVTKDRLYLITAYFLTSGLNYAFGVALSWFFSPAEFGVLGVAQSLLLLLALAVGSGFAWTAAHDVASAGVNDGTRKKFRAAWLANLVLGIALAAGLWLAYDLDWLPLGPAYRTIIPLAGLTVILLAVRGVSNGAMRGLYRFGPLSVNLVGEVVVKVAAGIGLVALGWGVSGVMAGFVLGAGLSFLHSLAVIRPARMFEGRGWADRSVVSATVPLFISMLGTALMLNLDVLGLKLLAPVSQGDQLSGFYQAAVILARTPVFLAQALTLVMFSYAAAENSKTASGEGAGIADMAAALRAWLRFLLPIGLVMMVAPRALLGLFFPEQYLASSGLMQIAALGGLLLALVNLVNGILQARGSRSQAAAATALATLVQIVALVLLVPRWGAAGAAVSLVAAGGVALAGMLPAGLPGLMAALRPAGLKGTSLLAAVLPLVALILPLVLIPDSSRLVILVKLVISAAAYGVVLLLVQAKHLDWNDRPLVVFSQLVQVFLGGG